MRVEEEPPVTLTLSATQPKLPVAASLSRSCRRLCDGGKCKDRARSSNMSNHAGSADCQFPKKLAGPQNGYDAVTSRHISSQASESCGSAMRIGYSEQPRI